MRYQAGEALLLRQGVPLCGAVVRAVTIHLGGHLERPGETGVQLQVREQCVRHHFGVKPCITHFTVVNLAYSVIRALSASIFPSSAERVAGVRVRIQLTGDYRESS